MPASLIYLLFAAGVALSALLFFVADEPGWAILLITGSAAGCRVALHLISRRPSPVRGPRPPRR